MLEMPDSGKGYFLPWLILGYLSVHPDAKDTVVGISRWWLYMVADVKSVTIALDQLVIRGWLNAVTASSGERIYALNQDHRVTLRRFLEDPSLKSESPTKF